MSMYPIASNLETCLLDSQETFLSNEAPVVSEEEFIKKNKRWKNIVISLNITFQIMSEKFCFCKSTSNYLIPQSVVWEDVTNNVQLVHVTKMAYWVPSSLLVK